MTGVRMHISQAGSKSNELIDLVVLVLVTFLSSISLFLFLARHLPANVPEVLTLFADNLFNPNKNLFDVRTVARHNTMLYFYFIIITATLIILTIKFLLARNMSEMVFSPYRIIFCVSVVVLFLLMGFQMRGHMKQFEKFGNKTTEQKIAMYFKNSYGFAQYCKRHLPGKHWAKPITDLKVETPEGMLTAGAVAYYLLPIHLRSDLEHPKDCLVIFQKEDPLNFIPEGFRPFEKYDDKSLIAVKIE